MNPTLPTRHHAPVPVHGRGLRTCRGVLIGGAHIPPPPAQSRDADQIQSALLEPCTARPLPILHRIAGAVWRWC